MTVTDLEKRLDAVEQELAELRARVDASPAKLNAWIEKGAGAFSTPDDRAAFDEAMSYGRKWRMSQRINPRGQAE